MRRISYSKAINEALFQMMELDKKVFLIGVGVNSPWYVGKTTERISETFGEQRIIDTPVSENGITGFSIGAAITGMRPVLVFPRMDFMYYAMDQLCNHASNLNYSFGGRLSVPLTIRSIINRGGEQAAQHSQALQGIFMHMPGLKVVMPADAYDAKGMLIAAIKEDNPILYIDDRWLYDTEAEVPEEIYTVPLNKGKIIEEGDDLTLVASSYMVFEAKKAVDELKKNNIKVELIDLRSIKPLDSELLLESIAKTGRLIIADGTWKTGGVAAEVSAIIASEGFDLLKAPIKRVTLPDLPAPASGPLEKAYYPACENIIKEINNLF